MTVKRAASRAASPVASRAVSSVASSVAPVLPAPPKAKNVPAHMLETQKLSGEYPHLPDIVKIQRKGTGTATAMVKICIDQSGHVNQVSIIQGIPGADAEILNTLRTWKYKPQAIPSARWPNSNLRSTSPLGLAAPRSHPQPISSRSKMRFAGDARRSVIVSAPDRNSTPK